MLERVDGVVVAVQDAARAAATYDRVLGAPQGGRFSSQALSARGVWVAAGESRFVLAEPAGPGAVREHLDGRGEGIIAAVVATGDPVALERRLRERGTPFAAADEMLVVEPAHAYGLRTLVTAARRRERTGLLSFLYEITHLVDDWREAAVWWAGTFGLDASRFCEIASERFAYEGTLTLFDPPSRLDRIEVVTPSSGGAMGRFFAKRGQGPYMCYAECADTASLVTRLREAGARFDAPDGEAPPNLWVHPSALHGVLLGVSATNVGWRWSGRPDLAPAGAA